MTRHGPAHSSSPHLAHRETIRLIQIPAKSCAIPALIAGIPSQTGDIPDEILKIPTPNRRKPAQILKILTPNVSIPDGFWNFGWV